MIADRYARALYRLAKNHSEWLETLETLLTLFHSSLPFFSSPLVSAKQKERILSKALKEHLDPDLFHFLLLLVKKNRFSYFPEIVQIYKSKVFEKMGMIEGLLITPSPISDEAKKNLADKWGMLLDKKIVMKEKMDPSLIGGGIFLFDDMQIDFSLKGKLERLQKTLRAS